MEVVVVEIFWDLLTYMFGTSLVFLALVLFILLIEKDTNPRRHEIQLVE